MKRPLAIALAALMLCSLLAGCAASNPDGSANGGGAVDFGDTLTVVTYMQGTNFDPLTTYDSDWLVCGQIYDTLFRMDENGNVMPHVAESWEESPDGMKLTIKLREGIKFHDGTPLNAEAVIFSFDTSHGVELNAWLNDLVPEWKAIDEYTIEITKGQPYTPIYYSLLARPHIVSPTAYKADPVAFAQNPVGSGPYKFVSMGTDDVVKLVANDEYFLGKPYFENLEFRPPMESATSVIALQNGEVDIVLNLTPSQIPVAKSTSEITVMEQTGWAQTMILMSGEPFTGNRALRQAVAHAVDPQKAAILNEQPNAAIATDLFSAKEMGSYAGLVPPLGYDTSKVPALLEEAGYTSDIVIPIRVTQQFAALAQSVQADLQAAGITSEIIQVDENTHNTYYTSGEFGLSFWEYGNDQSSTEDLLTYFTSTNFYGRYMESSPEYDALVAQFGDFPTDEARKDVMKQALELQVVFANMVPLYESTFNFAYRTGLTGFNPWSAATYRHYFGDIKPAE